MEQVGLPVPPSLIARGSSTTQGGVDAANWLLDQDEPPTAIVAYGDASAIGILHACHTRGLRVPEDVAVIGFGGTDLTAFVHPPLSTVLIQNRDMGYQSVRLLLDRIVAQEITPALVKTDVELIVRGSTVAGASAGRPPSDDHARV
jgi:LacI family transcriptional regulator